MRQVYALLTAVALFYNGAAAAQLPEKVGDTPVPSLAPIVKKASPAVVNIATRGTVKEQRPRNPLLPLGQLQFLEKNQRLADLHSRDVGEIFPTARLCHNSIRTN